MQSAFYFHAAVARLPQWEESGVVSYPDRCELGNKMFNLEFSSLLFEFVSDATRRGKKETREANLLEKSFSASEKREN